MGNFLQQLKGDLICRPDVSQKVIDAFADIVDKQDSKGLKKYGESIDQAMYLPAGKPRKEKEA